MLTILVVIGYDNNDIGSSTSIWQEMDKVMKGILAEKIVVEGGILIDIWKVIK